MARSQEVNVTVGPPSTQDSLTSAWIDVPQEGLNDIEYTLESIEEKLDRLISSQNTMSSNLTDAVADALSSRKRRGFIAPVSNVT